MVANNPRIVNTTLGMPNHPGYNGISSQNTRLFVEQPIRTNTVSTEIWLKMTEKSDFFDGFYVRKWSESIS